MTPKGPRRRKSKAQTEPAASGATIGYEAQLWRMADAPAR